MSDPTPTFERFEDAREWLDSEAFRYPGAVDQHNGKPVLKLFALTPAATLRYSRLEKQMSNMSWKDIAISAAKTQGASTIQTIAHAHKGNIFGMLQSAAKVWSNIGKYDEAAFEQKLADTSPELAALSAFEESYRQRQITAYPHLKAGLWPNQAGPAVRRQAEIEGQMVFMLGLSRGS